MKSAGFLSFSINNSHRECHNDRVIADDILVDQGDQYCHGSQIFPAVITSR